MQLTQTNYEEPTCALWDVVAYGLYDALPQPHTLIRFVSQQEMNGLPLWTMQFNAFVHDYQVTYTWYALVERVWIPIPFGRRSASTLQSQPHMHTV